MMNLASTIANITAEIQNEYRLKAKQPYQPLQVDHLRRTVVDLSVNVSMWRVAFVRVTTRVITLKLKEVSNY
jgi:hypothetical protein